MKTIFLLALFVMAAVLSTGAFAQSDGDKEAIKRTALNYAEGWYEGNAEKMESALSPDLAKRIANTNPQGRSNLGNMSAMTLVQATRGGSGKNTAKENQQKDVTILDSMTNSATIKLEMYEWVDYMHIAKLNGKWLIVNVLWEMKPAKKN